MWNPPNIYIANFKTENDKNMIDQPKYDSGLKLAHEWPAGVC